MAFHKSNLGSFGADLPSDGQGFVPEQGDEGWTPEVQALVDAAVAGLEEWRAGN